MTVSKREKLIILVMFLAVAYGVYAVFFSSPSKTTIVDKGPKLNELNKLVTTVSQSLTQESLSEADIYIIKRAEAPWRDDLFSERYEKKPTEEDKKKGVADSTPQKSTFTYSGFMEIGRERIAIINGMQYQTGDEVKPDGYIVRAIHPKKVILEIKGKKEKIILPISEEEL
jgi:hypothetical protein